MCLVGRYAHVGYMYFIEFTIKLSDSSDHGVWDRSGYEPLVTQTCPRPFIPLIIVLIHILRTKC
jgi:hypothetical protein